MLVPFKGSQWLLWFPDLQDNWLTGSEIWLRFNEGGGQKWEPIRFFQMMIHSIECISMHVCMCVIAAMLGLSRWPLSCVDLYSETIGIVWILKSIFLPIEYQNIHLNAASVIMKCEAQTAQGPNMCNVCTSLRQPLHSIEHAWPCLYLHLKGGCVVLKSMHVIIAFGLWRHLTEGISSWWPLRASEPKRRRYCAPADLYWFLLVLT